MCTIDGMGIRIKPKKYKPNNKINCNKCDLSKINKEIKKR